MLQQAIVRARIFVALCALVCSGCASTPADARKDIVLSNGWRFIRSDVPSAQSAGVSDAGWQPIALPHTWDADSQSSVSQYRGVGWYRLKLPIDSADASKELFLRFEAASLVADVYVNGTPAGHHVGGFAAFCFDITHLVHAGENLLAVRVDNSRNSDVPPLYGDFTICGGLYRNVHLLALNSVHISPLDDASPGVYLTPINVSRSNANVHAVVKLTNDSNSEQTVDVRYSVWDEGWLQKVETAQTTQSISAHAGVDATADLIITQPHLWNGIADPYLYHVSVELLQHGKLLDRVDQPLGLRTFRVDSQLGYILNDRPYPLHGVGVHQDFGNKGWATTPADITESYKLIKEIGANTVRLAHYQHPEFEYSLCDKAGIVVWAEACLVNRVTDSDNFDEAAREQLRELIKQNYNHPSIMFWSLFNELGPRTRTDWHLVHDLNDIAHTLDPTRLTVAASHLPVQIPLNGYPDLIGFNRYFGWYTGGIADWPTELDKLHNARPNEPFGISEYGAGASSSQHEQPTTRHSTGGHWHPEDWQSLVHEAAWSAIKDRPWLWATYIWCMFDFAADGRDEGDTPNQNDKGLVTADRQTRKDAFYFYKANWSHDPFVHITDQRWNPRPVGPTQVKIYSNCDSVELYFNGKFLGTRSSSNHVMLWNQILLSAGSWNFTAIGRNNELNGNRTPFVDRCTWAASPDALPASSQPTSRPTTQTVKERAAAIK